MDLTRHIEDDSDDSAELVRLEKLASFQLIIIRHAMKCMLATILLHCCEPYDDLLVPAARKIVYSTCSVHDVENEHVVKAALASDEAKQAGWALAPRMRVLPTWPRRGHPGILADQGQCSISYRLRSI